MSQADTRPAPPVISITHGPVQPDTVLADANVLGVFSFGKPKPAVNDPRLMQVPLDILGGHQQTEVIHSALPVTQGTRDGIGYACNGQVLVAQLSLALPAEGGAQAQAFEAYRRIHAFLDEMGYPHPIRLWNYIDDINAGEGDAEAYKQFCVGRAEALQAVKDGGNVLPAATAIGSHDNQGTLVIHLLAAHDPGTQLENPRQVSAFQYPRQYGIRSPLFSRARVMHWPGNPHLYLSGTASVVGHETLHAGNCQAQIEECLRNVDTILKASAEQGHGGFRHEDLRLMRVYLRNRKDLDTVRSSLEAQLGNRTPIIYLHGDICRQDLLVELEALYTQPQAS